jgi:hypothetical protein
VIEDPHVIPGRSGRPHAAYASDEDRSFADLASSVLENASALVRTELRIAKAEMKESATKAARGLALLAGAVALGLATVIMSLVALLAILEAIGMPVWLAAILTTLIAAAGTAGLALLGAKRLRADELVPGRTLAQLNKDRLAAKEQMK